MSDDIKPLESRITKIIGDEERINRDRKDALKVNDDKRNAEIRKEDADLAVLETEKQRQMRANTVKDTDYRQAQGKEGSELVGLSREIQAAYIAEMEHRRVASSSLQQKISTLETKLRSIEAGRRS